MALKEYNPEKLYFTTGDVAEIIDENVSLVRFWSDKFSDFIKPKRNKKGNRIFTKEDLITFRTIYFLVKEKGMTLDGAAVEMKNNKKSLDDKAEVVESLLKLKRYLQEIYDSL